MTRERIHFEKKHFMLQIEEKATIRSAEIALAKEERSKLHYIILFFTKH